MASPASFFDLIGQALVVELQKRRLARPPLGLVVLVDTWDNPEPRFEIHQCPENPRGTWGTRVRASASELRDMTVTLQYVDVAASHASPSAITRLVSDVDVFHRYVASDAIPGLLRVWFSLTRLPNVALDATYHLRTGHGHTWRVYLTFLTRFGRDAKETGFRDLNVHLLKVCPTAPVAVPNPPVARRLFMGDDDDDDAVSFADSDSSPTKRSWDDDANDPTPRKRPRIDFY